MNVYQKHGSADREEYLETLADAHGVPLDTVQALAEMLGPDEDFDGLVSALEDI